jgi:hypothetical protein
LVAEIEKQEDIIARQAWKVKGPAVIQLVDLSNTDYTSRFEESLGDILDNVQLTFKHRFIDFVSYHLNQVVQKTFIVQPTSETFKDILTLVSETSAEKKRRVATGNIVNIRSLRNKHPYKQDFKALSNIASSSNAKKILGIILEPFAQLVAHFSSELLSGAASNFAKDPEQAKLILKRMTELAVQEIPIEIERLIQVGDSKKGESIKSRFDKNMLRLKSLDNISTGIEGVVFEYPPMSNRYYKFTGGFAAANQLLGLLDWSNKTRWEKQAKSEFMT